MSELTYSALPTSSDKLSSKFILDALKDEPLEEVVVEMVAEAVTEAVIEPVVSEPEREVKLPPEKKYFRIGEVSEIVSVEPYVLRYWESEFRTIRPKKSSSGHRVYSRKDVDELLQIRRLLHIEKFSIQGAKKRLQEMKKQDGRVSEPSQGKHHRETLKVLAHEIKDLVQLIRRGNPGLLEAEPNPNAY